MPELVVGVPSRERADRLGLMLGEARRLATADTLFAVATDDDDPQRQQYARVLKPHVDAGFADWMTGPRSGLGPWTNTIARAYAGRYKAFASFGDDHVPRTRGWDTLLLAALDGMGGTGIVYPDDRRRDDIPEAVVISADIVDALGWVCEPAMAHYCVDLVWGDLGRGAGCLGYVPGVVVEHMHYQVRRDVARDATYAEAERGGHRDLEEYQRWIDERMPADVRTVKAVLGRPVGRPVTGGVVMAQDVSGIYQCKEAAAINLGGQTLFVRPGMTARAGHQILAKYGHLFEPLRVDFDVEQPEPDPATQPEPDPPATQPAGIVPPGKSAPRNPRARSQAGSGANE